MSAKVLFVEDNELHAETISFCIEELGFINQGSFKSAFDCLNFLTTHSPPDVILLDINIVGEINGIELASLIRKKHPNIPIIFITSLREDEVFEKAIVIQPEAYLFKPIDEKALLASLRIAYYKKSEPLQEITQLSINTHIKNIAQKYELTKREFDLMIAIMSGFNNKQISENLFISLNTVKYHIKNLYSKLDVTNRKDLNNKLLF